MSRMFPLDHLRIQGRTTLQFLFIAFAFFICAFCASGCIYTVRPSVIGEVVDGDSGVHIAGAKITLYSGEHPGGDITSIPTFDSTPVLSAITQSDGRFILPAKYGWVPWPIASMALLLDPWRLCVTQAGYEPAYLQFDVDPYRDNAHDVGRISLHRASTQPSTQPITNAPG